MALLMAVVTVAIAGSPTDIGILNVTAPPHSLDASGATDVTKGLQAAILSAKAANLALFLPPGRYLVSDTLHVDQQPGFGNAGSNTWHSDGGINIVPNRFKANVILGSVAALPARPTIALAPSAKGFGNASEPKNVMKIHNPGDENINMNQVIRGVDFELGASNPGAIGLFFHGAQGATVQDVAISCKDCFACFGGAGGAGGSHIHIEGRGGQYGMYISESEPAPVVAAATFSGQTTSAIYFDQEAQPPLILVGVKIEQSPAATAAAVVAGDGMAISAIDMAVSCGGAGAAFDTKASIYLENVVVDDCKTLVRRKTGNKLLVTECNASDATQQWTADASGKSAMALKNPGSGHCVRSAGRHNLLVGACDGAEEFTYVAKTQQLRAKGRLQCLDDTAPLIDLYGCHLPNDPTLPHQQWKLEAARDASSDEKTVLLKSLSTGKCAAIRGAPGRPQPSTVLKGSSSRVVSFAQGVDLTKNGGLVMDVVYRNGVRNPHETLSKIEPLPQGSAGKLADALVAKHLHWDEKTFPSFEHASTANAKEDCRAKGDSVTDDEPALSACLKKHKDVFLPRGRYRIGKTLELNKHNRLVGLSQTHSVLMPLSEGFAQDADTEDTQVENKPLVRTAAAAPATIAFLGFTSWWHLPIFTIDWRSKGGLYRNNYDTRVNECLWLNDYASRKLPAGTAKCFPSTNLTCAKAQFRGTGSIINFVNDEDILMTDHRDYRHLLVTNNSEPVDFDDRLRIYELNLEHAMSESNAELHHAHHVDIFGSKCEGSNTILWVRDSTDVQVKGFGPAGDAFPNTSYYPADFEKYPPSIIRMERNKNYSLWNLINTGRGGLCTVAGCDPKPITPCPLSAAGVRCAGTFDAKSSTCKGPSYDWMAQVTAQIVQSEWAPWPGYNVDPRTWSLLYAGDGVGKGESMQPLDRPVAYLGD